LKRNEKARRSGTTPGTGSPNRKRLPGPLEAERLTLRPLRLSDVPALLTALRSPEIFEHICPGPQCIEDFTAFTRWSRKVTRAGRHLVYGVVPHGSRRPVGVVQLWKLEADFSVAECGFVLGREHWGTGLFLDAATRLFEHAFRTLGVHRVEARAAVGNGRGNAALRKLGMLQEARLRSCFRLSAGFTDHFMWAMLEPEWRLRRVA
jgi:RimJ/RimL family protein N-acetyltransferase